MNFKSTSAIVVALAFGFVACDSDSSSGPQDDPTPSKEYAQDRDVPGSYSEIILISSSSSNIPSSSSSANVTRPNSSSAECYKDGMADITVRNMERSSITCPNTMTIYDYDLQIFYKCEGSALMETDMAPCGDASSVTPQSSGSETSVSSSGSLVEYGTLADPRDGKSYKTVVIGGKTWMAENLNLVTDSSFCVEDIPANCDKYGRLYQEFDAAKACPEGWAIPQASDWRELANTAKEQFGDENGSLRAVGQWENTIFGDNVTATNASGFSALPAGYRAKTGEYDGEGTKAYFWGEDNMNRYAWILSNQYDLEKESLMRGYFAYAIRCISSN